MADVTTVIRVHSIGCLPYLKRALFSLIAQGVGVVPIIVMQNLSDKDFNSIKDACELYRMGAMRDICYVNVSGEEGKDIRSRLLNVGVSKASTRFLHFLDFDDLMYADAYHKLTNALLKSQAAIAFGAIVSCYFENVGGKPYIRQKTREYFGLSKYDLFVDNFCPLHSFVIDLSKVEKSFVKFDESMTALEDYSFLLDFLAKHEADFSEINHVVGEYFKRDGGTIAAADNEYPDPSLRLSRLQKARETILIKKRSTKCEVRLSEFSWLTGKSLAATIRDENALSKNVPGFMGKHGSTSLAIQNLQSKAFLDLCRSVSDTVDGNGYVDFLRPLGSSTIIGGWLNDFHFCDSVASIFAVHKVTLAVLEATRTDREDVRAHLSSEYKEFGFELKIDDVVEATQMSDWHVMMYSPDNGILKKIPISDGFSSEA